MNKLYEEGTIEIDQRIVLRSIKKQAKGKPIVALIELIINSNDSYNCIGTDCYGKIGVEYKRDGSNLNLAVRDNAKGMSLETVKDAFTKFGKLTSGFKEGKKVGGYFGTGAKAALAVMKNGKICTFHNDKYIECYIWIDDQANELKWRYSSPEKATYELREEYKIRGNGTVAYFTCPAPIPRFDTVYSNLSTHYRLRKIIINPKRKIMLIDIKNNTKIPLEYNYPEGNEILKNNFLISYNGFPDFPVEIILNRAKVQLLQSGEDRQGGLLILDEYNNPLDISMFKFDNEPLADSFFGEIRITNFRKLLENEEAVLDQERKGLIQDHPFCKSLISKIEEILEKEIEKEKKRREEKLVTVKDKEEAERIKKAFSIINEIAEKEILEVKRLGKELDEAAEPPKNGLLLYPSKANVTSGKCYAFQLRINPKKIKNNELIDIKISNPNIILITKPFKFRKTEKKVDVKWITIKPIKSEIKGILKVYTKHITTSAMIFVVPEKELLLEEGMVFDPESITLRPNKMKKVRLLVHIKIIPHESLVKISSENSSIKIIPTEVEVNEYLAKRHIQTFDFKIWGSKDGEDSMITAKYGESMALLQVKVRSVKPPKEKGTKGMFSDILYDSSDPLQRSSFSEKTGEIHIYYKFPSIKHYIGENCEFKKSLPAQVLIADIVSEQCFLTIAQKVVDKSGVLLEPSQKFFKIQQKTYELSKKYGEKIHKILVNQDLLNKTKIELK